MREAADGAKDGSACDLRLLMAATETGDAAQVKVILDAGGADLEARRDDGATAFLVACDNGHVECVEALSQAGCDKKARSNNGWTGLMAPGGCAGGAECGWVRSRGQVHKRWCHSLLSGMFSRPY